MEAFDGLSISSLQKASDVSLVTSNDASEKKNSESIMEAFDGLSISSLQKASDVSAVTSNDASEKNNSESIMEAFDGLSISSLEKASDVSPVTSNDASEKKNSEGNRRWVIRIPLKSKKADEDKEEEKKPWNLRPKSKKVTPERIRKFPVALSREEIEEDLAFLTVGKRQRKMQKTTRSDDLFPGSHLGSITMKSYNAH